MNSVLLFAKTSGLNRQRQLLIALLPVIMVSSWFFGYQQLINILICILFAITFEAIARILRRLPGRDLLRDENTLYLACLLGVCLPPDTLWWQLALGMAFAVLLAKHAYGGYGQNPFHPAMAGLLFLWLSFPETMQNWPTPYLADVSSLALVESNASASAWQWINVVALVCGIFLLLRRTIVWQIPLGIFAALAALPLLLDTPTAGTAIADSVAQLFYGGTMLTAFFIATDPPSSAMTRSGKLYYGLFIGCVLFAIRLWGEWPEGYAAAVILANFLAPLLDQFVRQPRYGHGRKLLEQTTSAALEQDQ